MNKKVESFLFNGTTIIDMGRIQGTGNIKYDGYYRAPGEIYMTIDMGIMDQSQNMELYISSKGKIFTKVEGTEWLPFLAPPNLSNFQQPGPHQNAVQILQTLVAVVEKISSEGTSNIGGKELVVVKATSNPAKLKTLISRQLTENARSTDDEKDLIKKLIQDMTISQESKVFIDPENGYIKKLTVLQTTTLRIEEHESQIKIEADYNYTNFNKPVTMPEIPGVTDL